MKALRAGMLQATASGTEAAASFAISVVVAQQGGAAALGRLATAMALLMIGLTATELGQNVVLTRRAAGGDGGARSGLGASLLLKALAVALLAPAAASLWPAGEPPAGLRASLALLLFWSWGLSLTAVLRGGGRFGTVAVLAALAGGVSVAGVVAGSATSLSSVLGVLAGAQGLKVLAAFAALPAQTRPFVPRVDEVRAFVSETLPFAAVVLIGVGYLKGDVLLLSVLAGPEGAGRYAAAFRLTEALKLVPTALGLALFPALAAGREDDLRRALALVAGFGGLVILGALAAGESALVALFGPPFAASAAPLRTLSAAFLLGSVNALLVLVLFARRAERAALAALSCALGANVVVNLALIPLSGAEGAAVACVASEGLLTALYVRALGRRERPVAAPALGPAERGIA